MNKRIRQRTRTKDPIRALRAELKCLRERVEDLEDLRDLNAAITRNAGKPGIPWTQVKRELGL